MLEQLLARIDELGGEETYPVVPPEDAGEQYGWRGDMPPPGAPEVPAGHRLVVLFWD